MRTKRSGHEPRLRLTSRMTSTRTKMTERKYRLCDCEHQDNGRECFFQIPWHCTCPVTKPDVMEDDMDDRTNLDEFLEKSLVAVASRKKGKRG